ncbi:MAG: hypothetical protein VB858_05550 [Planctomycetaceae bacterium]
MKQHSCLSGGNNRRGVFIAGAGAENTGQAVQFAVHKRAAGTPAVLMIPPDEELQDDF